MRHVLSVMLLLFCIVGFSPGCAAATPVNQQGGAESATSSPIHTEAPVGQEHTNERAVIIAPTIVMPAAGTADGKTPAMSITVLIGAKSDGDAKGQGKSESGPQTDSKTSEQKADATQTTDLSGLVKAAQDYLATVNPTSAAGVLAKRAIGAGNVTDTKRLLDEAKKASTDPGSGVPPTTPPVQPPPETPPPAPPSR